MPKEEFRRIIVDGDVTLYFVSESGRVLSKYKKGERFLKVFETDTGYQYVKLWLNNKSCAKFLHRLVAEAFIENPMDKPEVNHIDANKHNNHYTNLEWVTSKENKEHAKRMNLMHYSYGEDRFNSLYTNEQIHKVCQLLQDNKNTIDEISLLTNVSKDTIYGIRSKGIWGNIAKNYTFPKVQKRNSSQYSESDIHRVCELLEIGELSLAEISRTTGVKKCTVADIKHKRRWVYVSENYNI